MNPEWLALGLLSLFMMLDFSGQKLFCVECKTQNSHKGENWGKCIKKNSQKTSKKYKTIKYLVSPDLEKVNPEIKTKMNENNQTKICKLSKTDKLFSVLFQFEISHVLLQK